MTQLPMKTGGPSALQAIGQFQNRLLRMIEEPFALPLFAETIGWAPAVDVAESDGNLVVTAELPGMKKEDVTLELANGVLTLRGEKKEETERKEEEMHVVERSYGSFRRSFTLPCTVDETKAAAEFKDGVLRVTLPKTGEPGGKKIEIAS